MAGKIWKHDCYDLRKFGTRDVDLFVDIGASIGSTAIMARILFPFARVAAFEPHRESFKVLQTGTKRYAIESYNVALGPGTPMCFLPKHNRGFNRFIDEENKQWWPEEDTYLTPSKMLHEMFEEYKFDRNCRYVLKIDCEGGERYLFDDLSLGIIQNSIMTCLEIHPGYGGSIEEWMDYGNRINETHHILLARWERDENGKKAKYVYDYQSSFPKFRGTQQVQFMRKQRT